MSVVAATLDGQQQAVVLKQLFDEMNLAVELGRRACQEAIGMLNRFEMACDWTVARQRVAAQAQSERK